MVDVFNLALPYFSLILIGFACGKAKELPVRPRALGGAFGRCGETPDPSAGGIWVDAVAGPFPQPWAATAVLMASLPPALNVFVIARQNDAWIEPASVAVLIGTFASVVTLTSAMWLSQTGRLAFP